MENSDALLLFSSPLNLFTFSTGESTGGVCSTSACIVRDGETFERSSDTLLALTSLGAGHAHADMEQDQGRAETKSLCHGTVTGMKNSVENENCSIDGQSGSGILAGRIKIEETIRKLQHDCATLRFRMWSSQHGAADIEGDVLLFSSLRNAKEELLSCNDDVSFLSNRSKEKMVSLYLFYLRNILSYYFFKKKERKKMDYENTKNKLRKKKILKNLRKYF